VFLLQKEPPGRNFLAPPVQPATTESGRRLSSIPVVIDAREARPVQKTLMHSGTLWNSIDQLLVMHITHNRETLIVISLDADKTGCRVLSET
jgi:hypothetical protein